MNRTVLITGSSGGIGREAAKLLLAMGWNVVVNGRDPDKLKAAFVSELSGEQVPSSSGVLLPVAADASTPKGIDVLLEAVSKRFESLDGLILNSGHSMRGSFADCEESVWDDMVKTNLTGPALFAKKALPLLRTNGGRLLFVSTQGALFGFSNIIPYGATKAGLQYIAEALRLEEPDISVGVFYPGFTENDAEKKILSADGTWFIHKRKSEFTQQETARKLVRCFESKRMYTFMGRRGKLLFLLRGLAPGFLHWYLKKKETHK